MAMVTSTKLEFGVSDKDRESEVPETNPVKLYSVYTALNYSLQLR
jgi:hypothetical protein